MLVKPEQVRTIASIGGGPIGGGWTAHFLARGFDVVSYIHDPSEEITFHQIVTTAWKSLRSLGLAEGASLDRLAVTSSLSTAISDCQFVQESAPENLNLKQELYKK